MPYSELKNLYLIPKKETEIWRYLDPYKFEYLVEKKSIYFRQASKFPAEFKEGLLTKNDLEGLRRQLYNPNQENPNKDFDDFLKNYSNIEKTVFLSCWMEAEQEYDYMWKDFLSEENGVVIKSSVKNLQKCFNNSPTKFDIYISKTHYFDLKELLGRLNTIRQYSRKPKNFSTENEIRAILIDPPAWTNKPDHFDIKISLKDLIDEVRLSPQADQIYRSKINKICKQSGLNLVPSELT